MRKTDFENKYRLYKKQSDEILKESKSMHYQKLFEANKLNLRKTWEEIREVINIKKNRGQIVNALNNGEDIINENNKIAEKLNNHFCKIVKIIENSNSNPTTSDKIESQITYLQNHKASSPNSIPTTIFKNFRKNINVSLTELINLSFNQEKFPAVPKVARVTPIFRKGDRLNVNNYRPILLVSNNSKMIEKLIHKRLNSFFGTKQYFLPISVWF